MKQDRVIISVIVPVYNAIQWLDECVQSVLNQTFEKYELILVDDESTDGSGELCDRYAQQYEKIKVIHKNKRPVSIPPSRFSSTSKRVSSTFSLLSVFVVFSPTLSAPDVAR